MPYDDSDERWPAAEPEIEPRVVRWRMTPAQTMLWQALRRKQLGRFKFRRHETVRGWAVDFYCDERRLAVQIDRAAPEGHEAQDAEREQALAREGIRVLHVSEDEVSGALNDTLRRILAELEASVEPPPSPGDAPRDAGAAEG